MITGDNVHSILYNTFSVDIMVYGKFPPVPVVGVCVQIKESILKADFQ